MNTFGIIIIYRDAHFQLFMIGTLNVVIRHRLEIMLEMNSLWNQLGKKCFKMCTKSLCYMLTQLWAYVNITHKNNLHILIYFKTDSNKVHVLACNSAKQKCFLWFAILCLTPHIISIFEVRTFPDTSLPGNSPKLWRWTSGPYIK